jgi:hypothetical protein
MIVRHTHDLASAPEHGHMVTPFAIIMVIVAAYLSIPEWYLAQLVTILRNQSVRLLATPSQICAYARQHVVEPLVRWHRLPEHSRIRAGTMESVIRDIPALSPQDAIGMRREQP